MRSHFTIHNPIALLQTPGPRAHTLLRVASSWYEGVGRFFFLCTADGNSDTFGEIDTDGSNRPWEYSDGWAYRVSGTGPDGATFQRASWTFSGANALDNAATNAAAVTPMPIGQYA